MIPAPDDHQNEPRERAPMTLQTAQPLARVTLDASNRPAWWFDSLRNANAEHDDAHRGGLELDAPYQRGEVWTVDQQLSSHPLGV